MWPRSRMSQRWRGSRSEDGVAGAQRQLCHLTRLARARSSRSRRARLRSQWPRQVASQVTHRRAGAALVSDIRNPFFSELAHSAEREALTLGYSVLLANANEDAAQANEYLGIFASQRIDGLLLSPQGPVTPRLTALIASGMPVVLLNRHVEGLDAPLFETDNAQGVGLVLDWLAKRGPTSRTWAAPRASRRVPSAWPRISPVAPTTASRRRRVRRRRRLPAGWCRGRDDAHPRPRSATHSGVRRQRAHHARRRPRTACPPGPDAASAIEVISFDDFSSTSLRPRSPPSATTPRPSDDSASAA